MAWTSMHFAVGMLCAGGGTAAVCSIVRRGWRWIPAAMTAGGLWACVPDMPRLWRQDFPWLPLAPVLGSMHLESQLHHYGNIFFFHAAMDDQPNAYALHGLILTLFLYNAAIGLLMFLEHRQRTTRHVPLINVKTEKTLARYGRHRGRHKTPTAPPHTPDVSHDEDNIADLQTLIRSNHISRTESGR
jgi:hypothetical protein